jgi:hypothetical protein
MKALRQQVHHSFLPHHECLLLHTLLQCSILYLRVLRRSDEYRAHELEELLRVDVVVELELLVVVHDLLVDR